MTPENICTEKIRWRGLIRMWVVVVLLLGMLLSGVWVGVALGVVGFVILYFFGGGVHAFVAAPVAAWHLLGSFSLLALPSYILLGEVFVQSGIAERAYKAVSPLFERFPGKLLLTNTAVCAMFGAVLGSSIATAAAVSSIAYQQLSDMGYDRKTLIGNLAGSGTLGSYVPPSIFLIIYGSWVQVSVGMLFIAAVIPAVITVILFLAFVMVRCLLRPSLVPPRSGEIVPLKRAIVQTKGTWPLLILMASIMGAVFLGIATPTEVASIAVIMALIMSVTFRTFSFKALKDALIATARLSGRIGMVIIGVMIFTVAIAMLGIPRQVILAIEATGMGATGIIILVFLLYLVLGCFFGGLECMLMTLPFTFPLMMSIGADPFWFGIALVIDLEMGMLTPPVGMNLFVLHGVCRGEVTLVEIARASIPYFLLLGLTLIIIIIFPQLCTWLPSIAL